MKCVDCDSENVSGPDMEGFYDCHNCGAAWIPGVAFYTNDEAEGIR